MKSASPCCDLRASQVMPQRARFLFYPLLQPGGLIYLLAALCLPSCYIVTIGCLAAHHSHVTVSCHMINKFSLT